LSQEAIYLNGAVKGDRIGFILPLTGFKGQNPTAKVQV